MENIEQELNPATLEQTNSEPVNSKEDHQQPRTEAEAQAFAWRFLDFSYEIFLLGYKII